ncbi:MAG: nucleoside phosphorylase [Desulfatibacillaceae bacterium]
MDRCNEPIINPERRPGAPEVGPLVVMASVGPDVADLSRAMFGEGARYTRLVNSRLYTDDTGLALVGPVMGAPYAVFILEQAIAHGARDILFLGWCGSVSARAETGSLVVPGSAFIDEGTSRHYVGEVPPDTGEVAVSWPDRDLAAGMVDELSARDAACLTDPMWTTDAVFRETPEKVARFSGLGAVGVDMETSALFTVARFRCVRMAALCVVSDELHDGTWRPGFTDRRFAAARGAAVEVICALSRKT